MERTLKNSKGEIEVLRRRKVSPSVRHICIFDSDPCLCSRVYLHSAGIACDDSLDRGIACALCASIRKLLMMMTLLLRRVLLVMSHVLLRHVVTGYSARHALHGGVHVHSPVAYLMRPERSHLHVRVKRVHDIPDSMVVRRRLSHSMRHRLMLRQKPDGSSRDMLRGRVCAKLTTCSRHGRSDCCRAGRMMALTLANLVLGTGLCENF
jgi:hypothetical protein